MEASSLEVLEIISWVFVFNSIMGAWIMSNNHPIKKKVFIANLLFFFSNLFGIIFMLVNFHWGYLVRNLVFFVIAIRGIYKNRPLKLHNKIIEEIG